MRIVIVGAGAMGGLFGSMLFEAGNDVQLIDIWPEHVEAIKKNGLKLEEADGASRFVKVPITIDFSRVKPAELVIVFTKSYHTRDAARTAKALLSPGGLALTLQNGLGNADLLAEAVCLDQVVSGTTAQGGTVKAPGHVFHGGSGKSHIGPWGGAPLSKLEAAAEVLSAANLPTDVSTDVKALVWNKLMVNVGINAIVALTGLKNIEMLDSEMARELSRRAVEEGMAVARALKINVRLDAADYTIQVARDTGLTRASMGQDVDNRRRTEIMAINGAIAAKARELGIPAPVNETLTALIRTLEEHYLKK